MKRFVSAALATVAIAGAGLAAGAIAPQNQGLPAGTGTFTAYRGPSASAPLPLNDRPASPEAQARAVVHLFFETINAHQFARTCELFSKRFYTRNHVPDKKHCVLGLGAGLGTGPRVFFTILGVRTTGDVTVVRALANGAPGTIVLVKEGRTLKVLSVGGDDDEL